MKKVKTEVSRKAGSDLAQYGDDIVESMTDNANFVTPDPALATITADAAAIRAKLSEISGLDSQREVAVGQLATLEQSARNNIRMLGDYVQDKSDGNPDKIHSAGFLVVGEPGPAIELLPVQNLRVQFSDIEGQLKARWKKVRGASSYIIEYTLNPDGAWTQAGVTTRVSLDLTGLTPGQKYYVRVCAVGAAGKSGWSDIACKMAA